MWTRFQPSYGYLQKQLNKKTIGDVKVVQATLGKNVESVYRVGNPKLGGTILLELGVYTLNFADIVFGGERPEKITASGHLFDTGVSNTVRVSMLYSNKSIAHLLLSAGLQLFSFH